MKVVGHVEQMHLSRCYKESSTLSCLTCHDPHDRPAPADRPARYKAVCLGCHDSQRCKVSPQRRERESPGNDCVQCHMPRGKTDIPHFAFAHHRIGIHEARPDAGAEPPEGTELRPFFDLSHLGEVDQNRSLGLAYQAASLRETDAARSAQFQQKALELLSEVHRAGLRGPEVEAALAQLCFDLGVGDPLSHAEDALAQPGLAGQARCDALLVLAQEEARGEEYGKARSALLELTRLRRNSIDRLHLASVERALGDEPAAYAALADAVRINPRLGPVHRRLADYYRQHGDAQRAAWHQERATP
jgi:predicted CXXCH cytochrome family protein